MTAPMTMNRLIHAAVRRDLDRLHDALGVVQDGDRARAGELQRGYGFLRGELTRHHEGEDQHLWPWLATVGVDPDLLTTMEAEHSTMSEAMAETDGAMRTYATSGSAADAAAAQASVVRTRDVVEQHLDHEETELEPQLRPHLESPGWKAVEKKLRSGSATQAGNFFAWLTDGMTDAGRAFLRATVPTPVVTILSKVLGRRYHREVAPVWRAGRAT
jgi:hemerythrin-like domain-containing protein